MGEPEQLMKIRIDIPDGDPYKVERVWAAPLGNELYEVRNSPFYAFDLNWGDTVRVQPTDDDVPTVLEVVRRSGHKTLRIIFAAEVSEDRRQEVLARLDDMATNHEHAVGPLYALDCRPEAAYQAVCDYLFDLEHKGILHYETGATTQGMLREMEAGSPNL